MGMGLPPSWRMIFSGRKVDVITLGDHCWDQREIMSFFAEEPRLIRPFNFPRNLSQEKDLLSSPETEKSWAWSMRWAGPS